MATAATIVVSKRRGGGQWKWDVTRWEKSGKFSATRYANEGWCWMGTGLGTFATEDEARQAMAADMKAHGYRP